MVGGGGTVLRSRDGATFERRPTGLRDALVAVALAGRLVLAVSERGAVLRSQDGADTFQVLPGVNEPATSIAIDASGVLVGTEGGLWRSADRGATFSPIMDEPIQTIRVAPDGTVFALGGGHVTYPTRDPIALYRSLDGVTWRRRAVRDVGGHPRGWWSPRSPTPSARRQRLGPEYVTLVRESRALFSHSFAMDPRGKLFIGSGDELYTSTDGGERFTKRAGWEGVLWVGSGRLVAGSQIGRRRTLTGMLRRLAATPSGRVYGVGEAGTVVARTSSGWTNLATPTGPTQQLLGIHATDRSVVVVGEGGLILQSTDGQPFAHRASDRVTDLAVAWGIGDEVFAAGDEVLLRSSDRGRTWESMTTSWSRPYAIWGTAADLYLLAAGGHVYHSADRGQTWTELAEIDGGYASLWGSGPDLFVVGRTGMLARSRDRGRTWTPIASGTTLDLSVIWGDGDDLYVAGGDERTGSVVMRSRDRGATWHREPAPLYEPVTAVTGSASQVWILGGGTSLLRGAR